MVVSKRRPGAARNAVGRVRLTRPAQGDQRVRQKAVEGSDGVRVFDG
jgi:hypothetical protein